MSELKILGKILETKRGWTGLIILTNVSNGEEIESPCPFFYETRDEAEDALSFALSKIEEALSEFHLMPRKLELVH